MTNKLKFKALERYSGGFTQAYYYKVQGLDGKWHVTYGNPVWGDIIKDGLTEAEANAFLKLLRGA
jgi:hypothetical protein